MSQFDAGVVFGKFWPLHLGHVELLDRAASICRDLHVFVDDGPEDVAVAVRVRWVEEVCPQASVRSCPDLCGHESEYCSRNCSEAYAAFVRSQGLVPDAVFSGEAYGATLATCLKAASIQIDRSRRECRGREIRADITGHWALLAPPARGHYCQRVVVVGAESTGTTTLSHDLASHLGAAWVPEYGRAFTEQHGLDHTWTSADFVHIAERQTRDIEAAARGDHAIVVSDTDARATAIWHERYVGSPAPSYVVDLASAAPPSLYILTADEIPFVQDGYRDGEHIRGWMTARFREMLAAGDVPFVEVSGSRWERLRTAAVAVERHSRLVDG